MSNRFCILSRIIPLTFLLFIVCTGRDAKAQVSTTLNLNYVSETLLPGQTANVQGGGFDSLTQVQIQAINNSGNKVGTPVSPTIISRSANLIQIQIPPHFATGLWAVWLLDDTGAPSVTRYINQASGIRFNTDAVAPGGTLEIWGRNLGGAGTGASSALKFVDPSANTFLASASYADANHLVATVPATLTPGTAYQIYVSNGLGGKSGWTQINAPLTIRQAGTDPLNLGVPWAVDFTFLSANYLTASNTYNVKTDSRLTTHAYGDGVHDDTAAIQAAITLAGKSGGVVYLPAGTYLIAAATANNTYLNLVPQVVLIGAGPSKTSLVGGAPNTIGPALIQFNNVYLGGIANLTIVNRSNGNGTINATTNASSGRVFLANIVFQMGNGSSIAISNMPDMLITGCTFTSTSTLTDMFNVSGDSYLTVQNSIFQYRVGRLSLHCDYLLVRNNLFYRNGLYSKPNTLESGALEISGAAAPVITNNQFVVSAGAQGGNNDGETILTQDSTAGAYYRDAGSLTSASGLTVTDTAKFWYSISPFPVREVIYITSGTAMGQWRYVTAQSGTNITIDRAWDFTPPPGSQYSISGWTGDRVFVLNNAFTDSIKSATEFYDGAWYCTVSNNSITSDAQCSTNSLDYAGIYLNSEDQTLLPSDDWFPSNIKHNEIWENQLFDNVCYTLTTKPTRIYLRVAEIHGNLHGNSLLNNEVRGNTINWQAFTANGQLIAAPNSGYWAGGQSFSVDQLPNSGVIQGTIFEGNKAINLPAPIYNLGVGLLQTVVD